MDLINKKTVTKLIESFSYTVIVVLLLNVLYILFEIYKNNSSNYDIKYDYGVFKLNNQIVGMTISDQKYWLFYLVLFFAIYYRILIKNKIINKSND